MGDIECTCKHRQVGPPSKRAAPPTPGTALTAEVGSIVDRRSGGGEEGERETAGRADAGVQGSGLKEPAADEAEDGVTVTWHRQARGRRGTALDHHVGAHLRASAMERVRGGGCFSSLSLTTA